MSGYVPRVGRRGGARATPAQRVMSTSESGLDPLGLHSRRNVQKKWGANEAQLAYATNKRFAAPFESPSLTDLQSLNRNIIFLHPDNAPQS